MKRSTERMLVTHTGSLPRPSALTDIFQGIRQIDQAERAELVRQSVAEVVRRQAEVGVDVLSDGEMGKESYSTYVRERLTGFGGENNSASGPTDVREFPGYARRWREQIGKELDKLPRPAACVGAITLADPDAVRTDIANLQAAVKNTVKNTVKNAVKSGTTENSTDPEIFMSAASPGVISMFFANRYYPSRQEYLAAIAEAMRPEYEAIAQAGFVLQLDCPDLAMGRHSQFEHLSLEEFRDEIRLNVEILNQATANIDPDRMRLHLCWGNYEGPHHKDVPLRDIIDIVLTARPNGIVFEAANPRHAHEWTVFEDVKLPEGKILMPGVVDSTTNYIEHPELIAQRLVRYAELVGAENVVAATDCGFASAALMSSVDPDIVWAKLAAMAEGARLASKRLYRAAVTK